MTHQDFFDANRSNWNNRVAVHVTSKSYDVPGFVAGRSSLSATDIEEVGDVGGKHLLHLQCHFGMDTLSWARLGAASVTGLDFSTAAVERAQALAAEAGITNARFVESNVYDAVAALNGEQFDVVFTGIGALCWLPDIRGWANIVGSCLKPGGTFYIREGHPVLWSIDYEVEDGELRIRYPYFEIEEPFVDNSEQTYTDNPQAIAIEHTRTYEWNHGVGEVVTALIEAGLRIEFVHEWQTCDWQALPWMTEVQPGKWALPEAQRTLVPLTYSLRATKPA